MYKKTLIVAMLVVALAGSQASAGPYGEDGGPGDVFLVYDYGAFEFCHLDSDLYKLGERWRGPAYQEPAQIEVNPTTGDLYFLFDHSSVGAEIWRGYSNLSSQDELNFGASYTPVDLELNSTTGDVYYLFDHSQTGGEIWHGANDLSPLGELNFGLAYTPIDIEIRQTTGDVYYLFDHSQTGAEIWYGDSALSPVGEQNFGDAYTPIDIEINQTTGDVYYLFDHSMTGTEIWHGDSALASLGERNFGATYDTPIDIEVDSTTGEVYLLFDMSAFGTGTEVCHMDSDLNVLGSRNFGPLYPGVDLEVDPTTGKVYVLTSTKVFKLDSNLNMEGLDWIRSVAMVDVAVWDTPGPVALGDVNRDGLVDTYDITQIIGNWGITPASRADGDLDGDGVVGQSDYDEVLANWGSAPEPATMGLLLIGALATLLRRRKSLMIIVAAGCLALLGFPLSQAYAIDGDPEYDIDPITYYNPSTQATTNFFAIGWYVVRTETSPAEIAYAGGNTAAPSHQDGVTMADISDYLDQASTAGVKVLIRFLASEILDPAVATAWATEFVDHPALLGYQLGDENTHKADPWTAANVGAAAAAIRAVDPDRQIWQVFPGCCGPAAIEAYMNPGTPDMKTDVVSQDHYWVRSGPDHPPDTFANAQGEGNWASGPAHTRNVAAEGCTTYGWAGNVSLPQACDAPYGDYRFPTYKEHRWDCFSAIASSGARGNLNWLDVAGLKDNTFREGAARPVALEQLKMAHALATGWNAGTVKLGTLADDDYYHANYPEHAFHEASSLLSYDDVDDKYYLIVVNNDTDNKENMKIKLSSLPHAPVGLAPGAENFTISKPKDSEHFLLEDLGGGTYRFTDTLDNHEVGVYEILTADASWRWKAVTDPGCPTGYISYDFFVEVGDNLGAMELILATPSSGDIYKNTDTDIPDDPDDLFDTYVTIGSPGAGEQPANTEVFGGALSLGGAPGEETFTDQNIDISWGPDGGVQTGSGEFHVARVTLKSGITATWSLMGLEFGGEPVLIAGASLFTPLPGDVDGDGFIDDNDLTIILNNWGKSGQGWFGGDLNSNGVVDGPDYAEVLSYWAPPAEPLEAAGVPEPLTLAILGIGSLLALIGRRRVVR